MNTYNGSCHCGKVTYTVETKLDNVITCNCSHCHRKGLVLTFVPENQFTLISGEESLTKYLFNKKRIQHLFCSVCGVESFAKGLGPHDEVMIAINVRCLPDVHLEDLTITQVDGKQY